MGDRRDVNLEHVEGIRADIRRYEASCGCEVGSVFALGAVIGSGAYLVSGRGGWSWGSAGWVGLSIISLSVIGKLIGLGYAQFRLARLRLQLHREIHGPPGHATRSTVLRSLRPAQLTGVPAVQSKE